MEENTERKFEENTERRYTHTLLPASSITIMVEFQVEQPSRGQERIIRYGKDNSVPSYYRSRIYIDTITRNSSDV